MTPHLEPESRGPHMMKHHVRGLGDQEVVFHTFTAPDGGYPHDHPWDFHSRVLEGGYTETVFDPVTGDTVNVDHVAGDYFFIGTHHVHKIIHLHTPVCRTVIFPVRPYPGFTWGFWDFREDGSYRKDHDGDWVKRHGY